MWRTLFINERRRRATQRRHGKLQRLQIFFNIITTVLRHIVHITARRGKAVTESVRMMHFLDRWRFPLTGVRNCRRWRRLPSSSCFLLFTFALPARDGTCRLRTRGRRRPRTQFGLQLKHRLKLGHWALESTSMTAQKPIWRSRRIKIDLLLQLLPELTDVFRGRGHLEVINIDNKHGLIFGVPVNTRPVGDSFPSTAEHAFFTIGTPYIASKRVPVEIKYQRTDRVNIPLVVPLLRPPVLGQGNPSGRTGQEALRVGGDAVRLLFDVAKEQGQGVHSTASLYATLRLADFIKYGELMVLIPHLVAEPHAAALELTIGVAFRQFGTLLV